MMTTLLLNPCLDRTMTVGGFRPGETNIAESVCVDAAGKGVNAAITASNLGYSSRVLGFCHGSSSPAGQRLSALGIPFIPVRVPGEIRVNVKIFDRVSGVMTEMNERGDPVPEECYERIFDEAGALMGDSSVFLISGSAPPKAPTDIYRRLVKLANERGVISVLDARGELMRRGVEAKPTLIKPNMAELCELCGQALQSRQDAAKQALLLARGGIRYVCVSFGEDGALLATKDGVWLADGLRVNVKSIQGAGDAMAAASAMAIDAGLPPEDILCYGMAAAAGSLIYEGSSFCKKSDFDEYRSRVKVRLLPVAM